MDEYAEGPDGGFCQPVWTYRGYKLDDKDFTTAMVHLYRAEVSRANTWRKRLDTTTNWAVVTFGAALTFAFGSPDNPHFILLLELMLILAFLYIESRRYRYYQLWSYRLHLIETDFFAAMLAPPFRPSSDWSGRLVETLHRPAYPMPRWEAVGRRFSRNYFFIVTLLIIGWLGKLWLYPSSTEDWPIIVGRATIGAVSGGWVFAAVAALYLGLIMMAVLSSLPPSWRDRLLHPASPKHVPWKIGASPADHLATIITTKGKEVGAQLLRELGRGVTELHGTGMYTGQGKDVLLCAVTDAQVRILKQIVQEIDADAFYIVSRAEEVRGKGFRSFQAPS
ncbi:MAG: DUF2270 domain-containing protein [Anaerolineae bacterium]|nr:DUF2270 domain-containing protein [Anaerolineae bacterium]